MAEDRKPILVTGAGFVGTSCTIHLARHGRDVTLLDIGGPANGASFGNADIIQCEAIIPYLFPCSLTKLVLVVLRRSTDVHCQMTDLPKLTASLARYWFHSSPARHAEKARAYAILITHAALPIASRLPGHANWCHISPRHEEFVRFRPWTSGPDHESDHQ